ncbi:D-cysteine desulfhydrase family protein [Desulfosporosinus meridiei]|uniref:1-aminocyclopropane-1-carboxylate deaminase n=1 Tax=Desulfosporosinus meridiei (strain ATCC BAA-275 / DSM 13257 / KCTC 12902 / NCIMB 13706 / S10) TaxID=768704 RepID=J7IR33_DESMD|nr:D-cysteine desulfhydrase family protein [Desulfosporosinus meridiei]AFQ42644.1 1-aminocyclopropane-1-carboxylate deaminase [Desulfosporosinus meridiei DSM 13257]
MNKLQLAKLPLPARISLMNSPTPLQKSRLAWGKDSLHWKRDDLTPFGLGGNKLRKLEFLLADALNHKADLIITSGAPQSNHARLTAVISAMLNLSSIIVIPGEMPSEWGGNLLLDRLAGAEIIACGEEPLAEAVERISSERSFQGRHPYIIPLGGSNALGSMGYFLAFFELMEQAKEQGWTPKTLVCSVGSAGTLAGLVAANTLLPQPLRLIGVNVISISDQLYSRVQQLASEILDLLQTSCPLPTFEITSDFIGAGYGLPTPPSSEVIIECFRTDGILFDPVYTAKGVAAVKNLMQQKSRELPEEIVFWHTGGGPAIFDQHYYTDLLNYT